MHKTEKYITHIFKLFDISPIDSGGITKLLVYILWGTNALLFLCKDINFVPEISDTYYKSEQSVQCTVLKKISNTDVYIENSAFVNVCNFVIILHYDFELPIHEVITLPRDRSPPSVLFS